MGVACAGTVVVAAVVVVVVAGVGVGGVGGGGVVGGVVLFGVGGGLGGSCLLLLFHPLHLAELGTSVLEPHLHSTARTTTIKTSCSSCTVPRPLNTLWVTQYISTLTNVLLSKRYTLFVTCPPASLRSVSVCIIIVYVCAFESWLSRMCVQNSLYQVRAVMGQKR